MGKQSGFLRKLQENQRQNMHLQRRRRDEE
nr:MAG TPA: hypothetical protein [Caudoviricetes sp.]